MPGQAQNGRGGQQWMENVVNKPYKSMIAELDVYIFNCGTARHAAQFTKSLKHIASCVLLNYRISDENNQINEGRGV